MKSGCFTLAVVLLFGLTVSGQQPSMRFDRVQLLEETSETSANVSLGDLNGDGHLDLMLAKGRHWPLVDQVLLNDGKGNIQAKPLGAADRTCAGLLVDLDGDRDLDVVVSNDDGRTFHPLEFGDNKGTAYGIATGDVDEDGVMDIAVARSEAPNVLYFGSR
jgi:FG-GAP-like repeat